MSAPAGSTGPSATAGSSTLGPPTSRLEGVDVARAVALLGMMSVHILPALDGDRRVTTAFVVASGRSSALFALLAGTGLALLTGGAAPRLKPFRDIVAGVLTRAALVAGIGLALGELVPPVAVILANYAVLFVVALAVIALPARALMALAAVWVVATPLVSHVLRADLPAGPGAQPSISGLAQPLDVLRALTLTGYYPVLQWSAYLFVGLAVGRLTLGRVRTAALLAAAGLALAIAARVASDQLLLRGGLAALRSAGPSELVPSGAAADAVGQLQALGRYGVPPTTTWWWQAVASPHTGTPFDLAHTVGSALAVLGLALLLVRAVERARGLAVLRGPVAVLAATGSMTLTIYTLHVVAVAVGAPLSRPQWLLANIVGALVFATLWRSFNRRGPLEQLVADAVAATRRAAA